MGTFGNDKGGFEKGNLVLDIIKGIGAVLVAVFTVVISVLGILGKLGGGDKNNS